MPPSSLNTLEAQRGAVEVGQFRGLLDRLSGALARSRSAAKAAATQRLQEHIPTLDRLQAIVEAVHRWDSFGSKQVAARDPQLGPTMRLLTTQLCASYRVRVERGLGSRKGQLLRSLLSHSVPDLLHILGKTDEENTHSDVIRWFLDPREATVIAPAALHGLVERLRYPAKWHELISAAIHQHALSVRREHAIQTEEVDEEDQGRIDLLISGPGFRMVIENKVGSEEHDNQTDLYWRWLETQRGLTAGIFLSPIGFPARNANFKALSYTELLGCLLEGPLQNRIAGIEEAALASYVKTLAAGVLRQELSVIRQTGGKV